MPETARCYQPPIIPKPGPALPPPPRPVVPKPSPHPPVLPIPPPPSPPPPPIHHRPYLPPPTDPWTILLTMEPVITNVVTNAIARAAILAKAAQIRGDIYALRDQEANG